MQSDLEAGEGEHLRLEVEAPAGGRVALDAIVWHAHRVRSRTTGAKGFLLGLVVSNPPEAWFERVGAPRLKPEAGPPASSAPPSCCGDAELESFLVRVKQNASPRTRIYRVQAASLAEARAQAEAEAGDAWRVLEVRAA